MITRTMRSVVCLLALLVFASLAGAQVPGYSLVLKNDSVVGAAAYEFDVYIVPQDLVAFELASLQAVLTFNSGISDGTITLSLVGGSSELLAAQQPASFAVVSNELRIDPRDLPGAGNGTIITGSSGVRVGRFRISSSLPWNNATADIAWKNAPAPATTVEAYVAAVATDMTDSTGHIAQLANPNLLPATQLAFAQQPSNATAGAAIAPAVTVQIENAFGVAVAQAGVPVTVALAGGSGQLTGTLTKLTDGSGLASFTDLKIDTAGSKTLSAASAGLTGATSAAFTVSPGAGAAIVFAQQPSTAVAGAAMSPAVTVQVQDGFGNNVALAGATVTMTLASGSGTLSGTLVRNTNASGLATFNNLSVNLAGTKQLGASATGNGLGSATSAAFTVTAAAANRLAFIQPPTSATAGVAIAPAVTVQVQDQFGNAVPVSGTTVSVALASGTGTLSGTTSQATNSSGIATFADLSMTVAGAKTLSAASTGLTGATSGSFTIAAAAANKLAFIQQPTNRTAGATITPAVTVQVEDQFNNPVSGAGVPVALTLTTGTGVLSGTLTQATNASGLATFADLSVNLAGSKSITAARSGLTSAVSNAFTISAAAASALTFVQEPGTVTAGAAISPAVTVQLRDAFGNPVASSGTAVAVQLLSGTGTLSGTTSQATNGSGLATFANLSINLSGSKTLRASGTGLTPDTTASFTVSPGTVTRVAFVQQPTSALAGVVLSPPVTVELEDALGNTVPTGGVAVTLSVSSGTGTLGGTTTRATSAAGVATFDDLAMTVSGAKGLTAASTGLASAVSSAFTISPAAASQLTFTQQPSNATAGATIAPAVSVQLRDAFGNAVSAAGVPVTVALTTGSGTLGGTTTQATNASGVATFADLALNLAGTKGLTASATGLAAAASAAFTITPAAATQLAFVQEPTNATAGDSLKPAVTVQLRDAFGNNVAVAGVAVTATLLAGTGTLGGTTVQTTSAAGLATFANLSVNLSGTKTLRASAAGLTPDTSAAFTIAPAAASQLAFLQQPTSTTAAAVIAPAVTVQLLDPFGNSVPSAGVAVTAALGAGTGTLSGTLTRATNASGVATFNDLSVNLTGTKSLVASAAGVSAVESAAFTVASGAAKKVVFVQQPTNVTAGVAIAPSVTVELEDSVGNAVPTSGVAVTLTLASGTGVAGGTLTRTTNALGLATFNDITVNLAGTKTLGAASAGVTSATSSSFTVTAAAAAQLVFTQEPTSAVAGASLSPAVTVRLRDAFGNNVSSSGVSVAMTLASGTGTLGGTLAQVTNAAGTATFANLSVNLAGAKTLRAASAGLTPDTSASFTISPAPASQLTFVQQPTNAVAVAVISPAVTVQLLDPFGNAVPSAGVPVSVSLSSGTGTLAGTLTRATSASGLATFNDLSIDLAGSKTLLASATGLSADGSAAFSILPGAAAKVTFIQQPANATAGVALNPAVTVQLQDVSGNAVPTSGVPVTVALASGTGTLSGTLTQATNASGVATFADLSVNLAGTKSLGATSTGVAGATSASFTIAAAAASQLAFVQQPSNTTAGATITPSVTVQIRDAFGNNVAASGVSVTVSLASGTGAIAGTLSRTTSGAGLATFNDLSISASGAKSLAAASGVLSPGTSTAFTIAPAAVNRLLFVQEPSAPVAGAAFTPAVTVQLADQFGNAVATAGTSVSLTMITGTGTLSGTTTQLTGAAGIATYANLSVNLAGAKTLRAASTGLAPDTTAPFTVSPAAPSQLILTQQPTSATAGIAITPAVTVQLRDAFGNNVPSAGTAVTMSLSSGTGTLGGTTTTATNASGIATFADLSVDLAGSKTLTASASGLTPAVSTSFSIFAAAAARLAFVQEPTGTLPNTAISPPVTVQIRDDFGNNVSASGVSITMALTSGTGTLAGTTTRTTNASGLATFNDLSINLVGTKALTASSAGLVSDTSAAFGIAAGAATTVRVETTPDGSGSVVPAQNLAAGAGLTVYAVARDGAGNFVANVAATWSLAGVSGGVAAGDLVAAGDAKSALLTGHLVGSAQLRAVSGALTPVNSGTISVVAGAPSQLVFTQQPSNGVAGAFIAPAVTVQLRDAQGNNAAVAGTAVSMTLSAGTGALTGTTTQSTNGSGVATFATLSVNQPGVKTITASAAGLTPAVSASFTMTTYTITASAGANGSIAPSGSVSVIHGARQTFTMSPNLGYVVAAILVDGVGAGNASAYTFDSVTTNHTISVSFAPATLAITVTTTPPGRPITVDGVGYTSPQSFSWTANTTHTIATDSLGAPSGGKRSAFSSWSDGGASAHTVTPLVNTTYTATLRTQFLLTMTANTGGTVSPATGYVDTAATVPISATPAGGYSFSSWTGTGPGSVSGGANPANVVMGGPVSEVANFSLNNVLITVNTSPPGRQFYVDGVSYGVSTSFSFLPGSVHTLSADSIQSATSSARFAWSSWSDGETRTHSIVVPSSNATYTALFKRQFFLTVGAGTGGTAAPPSGWRDSAAVVAVSASPGIGFAFAGWTGSGAGSYTGPNNPANVTMAGPVTETAAFTLFPVSVTVTTVPPGRSFTVDGTTYSGSQTFTWSATDAHILATSSPQGDTLTRYLWSSWSDGGGQSHTVAPVSDTTFIVAFATQHYLTMRAGTGGTVAPASGWFGAGQSVAISATAGTGYSFASWTGTGSGAYSGGVNAASATMNGPVTETANFTPNTIAITVTTSPAGRSVIVDGTTYTAPRTFTWVANTNHTIATDTLQPGATGTRYAWSSWSDGGGSSHTVSPLVATTYTANFGTQYTLTTNAGTGGTVAPPTGWFAAGQSVPVTATAATGYSFGAWTGSGSGSYSGTANPASVTMNAPVTETAAFTANSIQVTVTTSPGGRTITVDGTTYTAPRTFTWTANTNHTIQADSIVAGTSGTRYVYASWSDGGAATHTVAPLVNTTYTATFATQYFLTMNANVGGTVLPPGGWYPSGQAVPITATAADGYAFLNWNGSGVGSYTGSDNPAGVTMNGPVTETANFAQFPYQVTVGTNPAGRAYRVNGVDYTTPQTFSIPPGNGLTVGIVTDPQPGSTGTRYVYASWSDSGAMSHFFIPTSDTALVATFTTQYLLSTSAGTGGSVTPGSGWIDAGTNVAVRATPSLGFTFSAWTGSGNGSYTGPNNPATVTMNGPVSEAASFTLFPVQLTLRSSPPGRSVIVDGTAYTTPQTFTFTSGTTHHLGADSLQDGTAGTRYAWSTWSDGGGRTHDVTLLRDTVVTAAFATQFLLTTVAGAGGTVSAGGWLDSAQSASISATPAVGYAFGGWTGTGGGSYTGANNPAVVTMHAPVSDSAAFTLQIVQVTVASAPAGRTVIVDGTVYTAPQTFSWFANSSHTIATDTIQAGAVGTRYVYASWSDSGGISHLVATSAARTYTVTFATQYFLTMNNNAGGSVSPPSGWFARNAAVTVTATPDNGYGFLSWSGTGTGSYSGGNNPATVFMSGPISQTANFGQNAVLVTVRTVPTGRTFIVDGTTYTSVFTFSMLPGSVHTLTADSIQVVAGGTRYLWTGWSDLPARTRTLEVGNGDTLLTATFRTQYGLTTAASPGSAGIITPPGTTYFNVGDTATVSAAPNSGWAFTGWTGSITSPANPVKVVMSAPKSATATFAPGAQITVQTNPPGRTVTVDDSVYTAPQAFHWLLNSSHTIATTTPQQLAGSVRYLYNGWSDGGAMSHAITVTKDSVLTASFTTQYYLFTSAGSGGSVTPGEAWHNAGDSVTITATPDSGHGFIEWQGTGTGAYSGGSATARIAMNGWIVETASFGALLPAPTLAAPANGSAGIAPDVALSWRPYPGATGYIAQVSADSLFGSTVYDSASIADTTVFVRALANRTTFFWRVKAKAGTNVTAFSSPRAFTTRPKAIAPVTPSAAWVTRYVQRVSWTSVDLAGAVNILLSTNGGVSWSTLAAGVPNSGTYAWRLPDATPTGVSCRLRVAAALDPAVYGETGPFAIVSGQLPLIVPLSTIVAFPDDPSSATDYRLIGVPGIADSTKRVTNYLPGTPPDDWRMFWDNGAPGNYLEEMTPLSLLGTGRGYWLLKKRDFNFVVNMAMPPLDTVDGAYGVGLHPGWNILTNPFDRNVGWGAVEALNGLPGSAAAYGYTGAFTTADTIAPFRGYYFFNEESLATLRIPYPFGAPALHAKSAAAPGWRLELELEAAGSVDPANEVGIAPDAADGFDRADRRKPPAFMDQPSLFFDRPAWDQAYPRFNGDIRGAIGDGQAWEFTVTAAPGTKGTIRVRGLDAVPAGYAVALMSAWNSAPVDLRATPDYAFTSAAPATAMTLLVGTKEFVRSRSAAGVPTTFALGQNFPNPFNPVTSISVGLPRESALALEVYDLLGRRVATLAAGTFPAGVHTFVWDGTDERHAAAASGVYVYRLTADGALVEAKKMLLMK